MSSFQTRLAVLKPSTTSSTVARHKTSSSAPQIFLDQKSSPTTFHRLPSIIHFPPSTIHLPVTRHEVHEQTEVSNHPRLPFCFPSPLDPFEIFQLVHLNHFGASLNEPRVLGLSQGTQPLPALISPFTPLFSHSFSAPQLQLFRSVPSPSHPTSVTDASRTATE